MYITSIQDLHAHRHSPNMIINTSLHTSTRTNIDSNLNTTIWRAVIPEGFEDPASEGPGVQCWG